MHWDRLTRAAEPRPPDARAEIRADEARPQAARAATETRAPDGAPPSAAAEPGRPPRGADAGRLNFLAPPHCHAWTDIALNGDGAVWGRPKGSLEFQPVPEAAPSVQEAWQMVEALLSPLGRACTEASPSVDAKIPRDPESGFPGARLKILHPAITPGTGYPACAVRFFERKPVEPDQIVAWGMAPPDALQALLQAVADRRNVMIVGGTGSGKTTLLSALCHGIPLTARIVKVEDPEEIWLPHPDVVTLEARPAPPGSPVPGYGVTDGVDDAMRLAPSHILVGEVRTGRAALSLFRALMSDHSGLTTFHANGPAETLSRLSVILFADAAVPFDAARNLFRQAVDLVAHIGFRQGQRALLGLHQVRKEADEKKPVAFDCLWPPPPKPKRRAAAAAKPAARKGPAT